MVYITLSLTPVCTVGGVSIDYPLEEMIVPKDVILKAISTCPKSIGLRIFKNIVEADNYKLVNSDKKAFIESLYTYASSKHPDYKISKVLGSLRFKKLN